MYNNIKLSAFLLIMFLSIFSSYAKEISTDKINYYREKIIDYKISNYDSAIYYFELGTALAKKENDKKAEAYILLTKAEIFEEKSELKEAKNIALAALNMFYELDYKIGVAEAYHFLGIVEAKGFNYSQSASYFLRSIYLCEQLNNISGQISNSISYAMLNVKLKEFKKAEFYLNKALKLNGKDKGGAYMNIYNNLGNIYGMQGRPDIALKYIKIALTVPDSPHLLTSKVNLLMNAGNANTALGNLLDADKYYNEALEMSRKYQLKEVEAQIMFNMAIMHEDIEPKQCISYLEQALAIAKNLHQKELCTEILTGLYEIKKRNKDFTGALSNLEEYMLYKDSILNYDIKKDIEILQSKYELEKTESSLKDLELKNQKNRIQFQIGVLIAISLIVIASILFYYLRKTNNLNKNLESSILVRNKLLSIIAHDLKTPISNINTLMLEIKNESLNQLEQKMLLETLHQHTIITEETLENLLKWGQAQLKGIEVNKINFSVKESTTKIIALLTLQALSKDIIINNHIEKDININFDKDQFDFILRNVLSNALKFSNSNTSVTINAFEDSNEYVHIQIIDEGVGMDANTLKSLFNTTSAGYGTNNERGIGLGLGLIKEYMTANNGRIEIDSELGKGTVVNLYITI